MNLDKNRDRWFCVLPGVIIMVVGLVLMIAIVYFIGMAVLAFGLWKVLTHDNKERDRHFEERRKQMWGRFMNDDR